MGHVTMTTPIRRQFVIPRLKLDVFYLHAKFDDSSSAVRAIWYDMVQMGHVT